MRGAIAALLLALAAARAQANGALPATIRVLAPPGAPGTVLVTTNFGVISTTDGGGHWRWICEHGLGQQGKAYQLAADGRLLGLAMDGLVGSADRACGWTLLLDQQTVIPFDYFPDPADAGRVLVLGIDRHQQRSYQVAELVPAGPRILYTAPMGFQLSTVELARTDRQIVYVTQIPDDPLAPAAVARSKDGGATWSAVAPAPPEHDLGILGVDRANPQKIYFRVVAGDGDRLLISDDGGQTVHTALAPGRVMSAFVQLANGHLLVGWLDLDRGYLDRSTDGQTFTTLPTPLHINSLAERDGRVYGAVDYYVDGYVLAGSDDEGTTWQRLMGLSDITADQSCTGAPECVATCRGLVTRKFFTPATCGIEAGADGGASDASASDAASPDAAAPGADATAPPPPAGGCSCQTAASNPPYLVLVLVLVLVLRVRNRSTAAPTSSAK
jgi:uncharacterized protein (TIGR03382 family)